MKEERSVVGRPSRVASATHILIELLIAHAFTTHMSSFQSQTRMFLRFCTVRKRDIFIFIFFAGGCWAVLSNSTDAFYVRKSISREMIIKDQTLDDTESSASN